MVFTVDFEKTESRMEFPIQRGRYGLYPVPRDITKLLPLGQPRNKPPKASLVGDLPFPRTPLCTKVLNYAEKELSRPTYNHSVRVYFWAQAIIESQWPEWFKFLNDETLLVCCLLHDLGTTERNMRATALSFEFYGAILARELLLSRVPPPEAPNEQVDSITEAIIRHQDLECVKKGEITVLGQVLQLATLFDNTGKYVEMVHEETVKSVVEKYPRLSWSQCFCGVIEKECDSKPWSHTTKLGRDDFIREVMGNVVLNQYEKGKEVESVEEKEGEAK